MKKKDLLIEQLTAFFKAHMDVFNTALEELDDLTDNEYLDNARRRPMVELNDLCTADSPLTILQRAFDGIDADSYSMDSSGNKIYGRFNPHSNYFYFNRAGDIVSCDEVDYTNHLGADAFMALAENRNRIHALGAYDDLMQMLSELDEL